MDFWLIFSFILYLLVLLGIGFYFSKKSTTMSDYFLGGRKMGIWVTALSAQASDMSSWLLMSVPGAVYISGLGSAWIAIGLLIGTYLNWKIVAQRLRKYSQAAGNAITIPQYLQNRFNSDSVVIRTVCAVIIFVFFLVYTASGFNAAAKLLDSVFGLNYYVGLTIGALLIMVYTFLGGFFAVVWTDFFQGLLMFFALLIVPIVAYTAIEASTFEMINDLRPHFYSMAYSGGTPIKWTEIISSLGWGLGYFGMPHILVRFMAIKDSKMLKKSRIIAMVWVTVSLIAAVLVGVIGLVYLQQHGIILTTDAEAEKVFMILVQMIVPGFFAGILLCAIVSAIMSTSDSQLLVTASAVTNDIYKATFKKEAGDKELLWVSRIAVIVVSAIAYIIALDKDATVMKLVSNAWAGFGASFGPIMLFSLFWKRTTMKGALTGMISGGLCVILWNMFLTEATGIYELIPAFILSSVLIVVVSLFDEEPDAKIIQTFESVDRM